MDNKIQLKYVTGETLVIKAPYIINISILKDCKIILDPEINESLSARDIIQIFYIQEPENLVGPEPTNLDEVCKYFNNAIRIDRKLGTVVDSKAVNLLRTEYIVPKVNSKDENYDDLLSTIKDTIKVAAGTNSSCEIYDIYPVQYIKYHASTKYGTIGEENKKEK